MFGRLNEFLSIGVWNFLNMFWHCKRTVFVRFTQCCLLEGNQNGIIENFVVLFARAITIATSKARAGSVCIELWKWGVKCALSYKLFLKQHILGVFLWGALDQEQDQWSKITQIMVHQRHRWIHSGHGIIGSFDTPCWILDPDHDPDHIKATHTLYVIFIYFLQSISSSGVGNRTWSA